MTKQGCSVGTPPTSVARMAQARGPIADLEGASDRRLHDRRGLQGHSALARQLQRLLPVVQRADGLTSSRCTSKTQTSSTGTTSLSVNVPSCYYQIDFVYGTVIAQFGPAGTNNFYGRQGRLISSLNGGVTSCSTDMTPTPPPATQTPVPALRSRSCSGSRRRTRRPRLRSPRRSGRPSRTRSTSEHRQCDADGDAAGRALRRRDADPAGGPGGRADEHGHVTCTHVVTSADVGSFVNTATATGRPATVSRSRAPARSPRRSRPRRRRRACSARRRPSRSRRCTSRPSQEEARVHKTKAVKAAKHTKAKKKVTKKAKPARPVLAGAHFTG